MRQKGPRTQVWDDEPIEINWRTDCANISCCDCGLAHNYFFRVKGSKLQIVIVRDRRATANIRRHLPNVRIRSIKEKKDE